MGELMRRDDRVAVEQAHKDLIVSGEKAIAEVYLEAFRTIKRINRTIVQETNAIQDEQEYRLTAPAAQATSERLARQTLAFADEIAADIRGVSREFRQLGR